MNRLTPCPAAAMTAAPIRPGAWHVPRLPARLSFYLQASITLSFLAGSSAPTPLYALYREEWGFSPAMLTVAFAVYAIAVLAALLVTGRLSDHVGRRPVLITATLAQAATMLLFLTAGGLGDLIVARIVQGLSAGAALAAVGAGLMDVDKARGASANAIAPLLGTAIGGAIGGVFVQFLPSPTHLVFAALAVVFVVQAVGLSFIEETATRRAGAWASLRPQFAVDGALRALVWRVAPAVVAVWALAGFYASLGPTLMHALIDGRAALLGGTALFVLAGSGALAVALSAQRDSRGIARFGMLALTAGLLLVLAALALRSAALFLAATAIAGIGFGTGFQGALRTLLAEVPAAHRAGVLSVVYVVAYLAMGTPAVLAGIAVAVRGDILGTAQGFAVIALLLALTAWKIAPRPQA